MYDTPSSRFLELDLQGLLEYEDNTCMYCGKHCDKAELINTGDDESFEGFEVWCWCDDCKVDTFYKIKCKLND